MTGTPRYAQLSDLREYLGMSGTTEDGILTDSLLRAENSINTYCRRQFVGTVGTLYYDMGRAVRYGQALYIDDDLLAVDSIVNGDLQPIPGTGYWLEPRNEGPPYSMIRLKSYFVWTWNTDGEITITGTIGYAGTTPPEIAQATVRLASYYYKLKDAAVTDVTADPALGVMTVNKGFPADVSPILDKYRRRY